MEIILKALLAVFWLVLVPSAIGGLFLYKKEAVKLPAYILTGYLFLFSLMEILALPMIYLKLSLHILVAVYGAVLLIFAILGVICLKKRWKSMLREFFSFFRKDLSYWFWFALILIVLQMVMVSLTAHFDADDVMYVGAATTAVHTDTIYSFDPYTGYEYLSLPGRYVLSPFPVFLAVISQLSFGLHPAIMAHVIFPVVFLGLAYLVQYLLATKWFPNNRNIQGIYLFFMALLNWFSAYSVYNSGNFQMVRIWQGKAFLASVMLPYIFYLCLCLMISSESEYSWLHLAMAGISCCLLSSMGIMLAPLAIGLCTIVGVIYRRKVSYIFKSLVCILPFIILGLIYLYIK